MALLQSVARPDAVEDTRTGYPHIYATVYSATRLVKVFHRCTQGKGLKALHTPYCVFHAKAQQMALQAAREHQQTAPCKEVYKRRAGIEGTLSQAAYALGMRRTRYRGLQKTITSEYLS